MLEAGKTYIDIEHLLQWAVMEARLPWHHDHADELAFDRGLTVKPRRKERVGWTLLAATIRIARGRHTLAQRSGIWDREIVLQELRRLPVADANVVIACAKARIRPNWMPGGSIWVTRRIAYRQRGKKRWKTREVLDPPPAMVEAARRRYGDWHRCLDSLARRLTGALREHEISGFSANPAPWEMTLDIGDTRVKLRGGEMDYQSAPSI